MFLATLMYKVQESVFLTAHVGYMSFGTRYPEKYYNYNLQIILAEDGNCFCLNGYI